MATGSLEQLLFAARCCHVVLWDDIYDELCF